MFINQEVEKQYNERLNRYVTALRGGTPDRIPIRFLYQEAAARHAGVTNQQVACDYNAAFDVTRKMAQDMGNDAVMLNAIWSTYSVAKAASWKYLAVPGVDSGMETVNQFFEPHDEEDMFVKFSEYEEFTEDPTAFLFNKWMPRAMGRVRPTGAPVDFDHNLSLVSGALAYANYMNSFGPAAGKLKYEAGVVSANSGMIKAPLDIMADKFRGYINVCIDGIEHPDKLLKACEALMPHILENALAGADPDKNVPITIWAHRGCIPFITQEMFDNIYWPTLKPIFEEIIRRGHQVLFYGEGNWEAHYDNLLELPELGIIYHIDKGDPALAAQKLKKKFAISGGLSYDALARGTTDDVRHCMKELFAAVKGDGGYILDATALMLSDIKPENVKAAIDYTMEHGVYSQSSGVSGTIKSIGTPKGSWDIPAGSRPPGVCRPWDVEKANYKNLTGNVDLVQSEWKRVDGAAYNYLWTSVLW